MCVWCVMEGEKERERIAEMKIMLKVFCDFACKVSLACKVSKVAKSHNVCNGSELEILFLRDFFSSFARAFPS